MTVVPVGADRSRPLCARRTPVKVRSLVSPGQSAPYFLDYVRQELEQRFDTGVARARGVRIVTTLDLTLQRFAEAAAVRGLDRLESSVLPGYRRDPTRRLQVAMLVVDPACSAARVQIFQQRDSYTAAGAQSLPRLTGGEWLRQLRQRLYRKIRRGRQ